MSRLAYVVLAAASLTSACRHQVDIAPVPAVQPHCWWNSQYTIVAPVWLASRFQSALVANGYSGARMQRDGDSAWATADPKPAISPNRPAFSFRMVAFPTSDSAGCAWRGTADAPVAKRPVGAQSCFHTNVLIYKPTAGWTPADSEAARAGDKVIAMCSDIIKNAIGDLGRLR